MKKWKCTVCGYIHEGEEPPEQCPVCGADKSQFTELTETGESDEKLIIDSDGELKTRKTISHLVTRFHLHPLSIHVPNGVLPLAALFIIIAVLFNSESFETAAYYNMIFVVITMPTVLASGIIDWQNRFDGNLNTLFSTKMICGVLVLLISVVIVVWKIINPEVGGAESASKWIFAALHVLCMIPAATAGYLGGKLVFKQ